MTQNELNAILVAHTKWINDEEGGRRAGLQATDLLGASLRRADLQGANLQAANLRAANLWHAELQNAGLGSTNLQGASLRGANLKGADLQGADLRGADIDYSCWPLWCGSLGVIVDRRIFCQLAYHLCRVIVDDDSCKEAQLMLGRLANEFHRAAECGRVPETPKEG